MKLLMKFENFQMVNGFVPEYQHSVCLGVTRQLANLWFDSRNHEQEWYTGTKSDLIDKELVTIKPPVEIIRVPRQKVLEDIRVEVVPLILCSASFEWGFTEEILESLFSLCVCCAHSVGRKSETL